MNHPICIIDDDDDIREVMRFALEFEGMESLCFANALEAESFLSKLPSGKLPCLLIVDYLMPEMDGLKLISLLLEKYPETLGKIPMVLSSGLIFDESENIPTGVQILEKPIDLEEFLKIARDHYQQSERSFSLS